MFRIKECKTEERKKNVGIGYRCYGKTEEWKKKQKNIDTGVWNVEIITHDSQKHEV
jgi:hypothetical protein